MVLIGSAFMARQKKREWSCTLSLLGLIQAPRCGKPGAVTAIGVLTDKSEKCFSPFNHNDEGGCATEYLLSQLD